MSLPLIAVSMGDPSGIGPEICLKILRHPQLFQKCKIIVLGDKLQLHKTLKTIKSMVVHSRFRSPLVLTVDEFHQCNTRSINSRYTIVDFKNLPKNGVSFGLPSRAGGKASGEYIKVGVECALKNKVDGLVTAPINKISFQLGGWGKKFTDHTEMLAALTGSHKAALMMTCGSLRAVHVTSHISLKKVSDSLSKQRIFEVIQLTQEGLKKIGVNHPKIAVCALNPHGGEGGLWGDEEARIIKPAVMTARAKKINVQGPLPADSLWPQVASGHYDVGVAMYHDQGQIPVKLYGIKYKESKSITTAGVNITLGLPIIRTSVAHGTSYDIAGKDRASEGSLVEAIQAAANIIRLQKTPG